MKFKMTRRSALKAIAAAGGIAAGRSLFPASALAKDLRGKGTVAVFDGGGAWGEALRIAYFEPFEKETGIKVEPIPRTESGAVKATIKAGAPRYDVMVQSGAFSASFAQEGLLLPIDYSFFENSDIDAFDPVKPTQYSVPHIIYSLLVAYDGTKFGTNGPQTWADMWDVKKFAGPRSLAAGHYSASGGSFEAALLADGVEPSKLYPIDWDRAFKSLNRIRPNILKFWTSGAEGPQLLVDKQVAVTSSWNGRIAAANEQGAKIGYSWKQGVLQYDDWMILKGARNVENASKFIAFASRPQQQAKFAEHILYSPPNSKAFDYLKTERAKLLPTYPEFRGAQFVQNYAFWNATAKNGMVNNAYAVAEWEKWLAGAR